MCEKNKINPCPFSYESNGKKIFITEEQAEKVYLQYGKYKYAEDLKDTINSVFEDDEQLNKLTVTDLLPYAEILEDLLRENSEEQDIVYSDCCEEVISLYVKKDFEKERLLPCRKGN